MPSHLLKSGVSTIKEITITTVKPTTSKTWPHKLSVSKASVTRSIAALKATRSSTGKASLTTRSTGLKAVSTLVNKAVSHLTVVGRILPTTLVELILFPPGSLLPLNALPPEAQLLQVAIPLAVLTAVDRPLED